MKAWTMVMMAGLAGAPVGVIAQETTPAATPIPKQQQLVTLALADGRIETAIAQLSTQIDVSVTLYGGVGNSRVTVLAKDQPVDSVLNQICNPLRFVWWHDEAGNYGIGDQEYYESHALSCGGGVQKIFQLENLDGRTIKDVVSSNLTPHYGSMVFSEYTNKLIVQDSPEALERITKVIEELDTPARTSQGKRIQEAIRAEGGPPPPPSDDDATSATTNVEPALSRRAERLRANEEKLLRENPEAMHHRQPRGPKPADATPLAHRDAADEARRQERLREHEAKIQQILDARKEAARKAAEDGTESGENK